MDTSNILNGRQRVQSFDRDGVETTFMRSTDDLS